MDKLKGIGSQAIALATSSAIGQLIVAALFIWTARDSAASDYGRLATAIAVGMAAIGIFDFGSNGFLARERAASRMTTDVLASKLRSKILIGAGLAASLTAPLLAFLPELAPALAIFAAGLALQSLLVPLRAARQGMIVAACLLLDRLIAVTVFVVVESFTGDARLTLWIALACGNLLSALVALTITVRLKGVIGRPSSFGNPWRGAGYYGVNGLAASAQQLDIVVLSSVAGATAAGIFGGVNRWTQPMGLLASAFSTASAPFVASAKDWRSVRPMILRASWILALGVAACVLLAAFAPLLVVTLLGSAYAGSVVVLQLLALGTVPAIFNQPLASALQSRNKEKSVAIAFSAAVILQLILIALLGTTLGALAAAIAYLALQMLLLLCLSILTTRAYLQEIHE